MSDFFDEGDHQEVAGRAKSGWPFWRAVLRSILIGAMAYLFVLTVVALIVVAR